jgi:ferric-dicitrate binding protein FerR (iron transport regulator)
MDYSRYETEDFVRDTFFQEWVLQPGPETEAFWRSFLSVHPHKRQQVTEAIELIRLLGFQVDPEANADFLEVWGRLRAAQEEQAGRRQAPPAQARYRLAAAFVGLLLLLGGYFLWQGRPETSTRYATGYGEVKTVLLPDSSEVTLNANSVLSFRGGWDRKHQREVWLEGEGFFHVRKKNQLGQATFRVHTPELTVEVLGTQFNVNNRRGGTQVVLRTGQVNLRLQADQEPSLLMEPGELVSVSQEANKVDLRRVDPELYTSWRSNRLTFLRSSLGEVAQLLEDTYGLRVVFADTGLAEKRFTGTIPADNIDLLFDSLTKLYELNITRKKNQVILAHKEP